MADSGVYDRWTKKVDGRRVPSESHGQGKRWQARWRDETGRQRKKNYERRAEAERFLSGIKADLGRGTYVDPSVGKARLRDYAEGWLAAQTFDESTREATELRLRLHVLPTLGDWESRGLRPSVVQAWTRGLQQRLAANYVRVIFANLSAVLSAAVDDGLIAKNPCRAGSVKPPAPDRRKVTPWTAEQIAAVRAALAERYAVIVDEAAGLGLRQGEVFGLAVDDVDWLRAIVHVRRQVKIVGS
jgi:integrase